jgi:hypothetical protein
MDTKRVPLFMLLFFASLPACGANVFIDSAPPVEDEPDAGAIDASDDAPDPPDPPPQCLCPDAPGYAPCVKPFECCPVVGQCKNPANFNCTGSSVGCP